MFELLELGSFIDGCSQILSSAGTNLLFVGEQSFVEWIVRSVFELVMKHRKCEALCM